MQLTDSQSIWSTIKKEFQSMFSRDIYEAWFENLSILEKKEDKFVLGVPNEFAAIWIQDNYHDIILKRLQMATGGNVEVSYSVLDKGDKKNFLSPNIKEKEELLSKRANKRSVHSEVPTNEGTYLINPKNTFDNFIVGSSNQLSHAACLAVANAPARAYNPLFLYGETGLGKTHLMHAVAHYILGEKPHSKVVYVSSEKFTNEFIQAIQKNEMMKFRRRYRKVDLLLIDDIHFLSGKERIQEEFFHTFNELFETQRQIILTSDRPVSEIEKLEKRLVSRFQWGLVTDVQAPDYETRLAILSKKAESMKLSITQPILEFLAERVAKNVRRMEGALARISSYISLVADKIDIPSVEKLLKDILQEEAQERVTIEKVQQKVTEHYQVRLADIQSKKRPANIVLPRQVAMFLSRELTDSSLKEIGEAFGGRDHGTVIHACKTIENLVNSDEALKRTVEYLSSKLGARL